MVGIPDSEYDGGKLQMMSEIGRNHCSDEPDDFQEQVKNPIIRTKRRPKASPPDGKLDLSGGFPMGVW